MARKAAAEMLLGKTGVGKTGVGKRGTAPVSRRRGVIPIALLACLVCFSQPPALAGPPQTDLAALRDLGRRVTGFVVWESNRSGAWELYRIKTDGTGFRQITNLATVSHKWKYGEYLRPQVSPDGRTVLFGYADRTGKPVEVWQVPAEGGQAGRLTQGRLLNWSGDGREFYFVRDHKLWRRVFRSGAESPVHETRVPPAGNSGNMVGAARSDLKAAVFRTGTNEYFVFDQGKTVKTTGGCEPGFSADGRFMYWVQGPRDFRVWDIQSNEEKLFFGKPPVEPHNYTYFPTVTHDGRWLTYGASPSQHDHNTGDYEAFVQELDGWKPVGAPVRLSWHKRTDRWPFLHVYRDETPPSAPAGLAARADGQRVLLEWRPSRDKESSVTRYKVYRDEREIGEARSGQHDGPDGAAPSGATYVDRSGRPRARYRYRVSAVNTAGLESGRSTPASVVTGDSAPSAPAGLEAFPADGRVRLTWTANPEPDLRGYRVFRSEGDRGAFRLLSKTREPLHEDGPVENEKPYRYRVSAVDKRGNEGPRSEAITATAGRRATKGLLALFTFVEGEGDRARDHSEAGSRVELRITDRRNVRWLEGRNGIELAGPGMAIGQDTGALFERLRRANRLTIEAWIEPGDLSLGGPARIVSMSADTGQRDFTLGQERSGIAFRLRTTETGGNGTPQLDTAKDVLKKRVVHVVCTFDGKRKHVYVDGRRRPEVQNVGGDFSGWKRYPLVVGNEATGDRQWRGKVFLVALYDRALDPDEIQRNYRAGCEVAGRNDATASRIAAVRAEPERHAGPETEERGRRAAPASGPQADVEPDVEPDVEADVEVADVPKPPRRRRLDDGPVPFAGEDRTRSSRPSPRRTRRRAEAAMATRLDDEPVPFAGDGRTRSSGLSPRRSRRRAEAAMATRVDDEPVPFTGE